MNNLTRDELSLALDFYKYLGISGIFIDNDPDEVRTLNLNPKEKRAALKDLKNNIIGDCRRCILSENRKTIVFGEGNADCELMFIGEGPGADEDIQGRPFVGRAGQLLTNLIRRMGFQREDVYIANVVKCRPPNNRNPNQDEVDTCMPFLNRQIEIIQPKVIMLLGNVALQSLLGSNLRVSAVRGKFLEYNRIKVMATFHPSYLLRNPKDKWLTWDDASKVLKCLGRDIGE